jgi:putative copper export protein
MLSPALDGVRLSLHVIAAVLWVGGQFTLAGLVPALRGFGPDVTRAAARRFAQLAWPAFAALVLTGIWNVAAVHPGAQSDAWRVILWVKLGVVVISGASAYAHQRATTKGALAAFGALSGLSATTALVLGVFLSG